MDKIAGIWSRVQQVLLHVAECLPPLTAQQRRLMLVLELARLWRGGADRRPGASGMSASGGLGRKRADRRALARVRLWRTCLNLPTTKMLIERLQLVRLRRG